MKRKELQERLVRENIPRRAYSLIGELLSEAYYLHYDEKEKVWEVYYGELGEKRNLKYFHTEEEACDYFYNCLIESVKRNKIWLRAFLQKCSLIKSFCVFDRKAKEIILPEGTLIYSYGDTDTRIAYPFDTALEMRLLPTDDINSVSRWLRVFLQKCGLIKLPYASDRGPIEIVLPKGTIVDRYGKEAGTFAFQLGTPFKMRSLLKDSLDEPYTIYEMVEHVKVIAGVRVPWFDQPGGGIQFMFDESFQDLREKGIVREIFNE